MNTINNKRNLHKIQIFTTVLIMLGLVAGVLCNILWLFPHLVLSPTIYQFISNNFTIYLGSTDLLALFLGHISTSLVKSRFPSNIVRLWLSRSIYVLGYVSLLNSITLIFPIFRKIHINYFSYYACCFLIVIIITSLFLWISNLLAYYKKYPTQSIIKRLNIIGISLGWSGILISLSACFGYYLTNIFFEKDSTMNINLAVTGCAIGILIASIVLMLGHKNLSLIKKQTLNANQALIARLVCFLGYMGFWFIWGGILFLIYFCFFVHIDG